MNQLNTGEIIEMIKFFGSIASTEGIEKEAKDIANQHVTTLLKTLAPEVQRVIAEAAGIQLV